MSQAYLSDFSAWIDRTTQLLQERRWQEIDVVHLIEEIKDLGKSERRAISSQLTRLLLHLLKWEYQPQQRSRSWLATLRIQRRDIARLLQDNPSLKPYLDGALLEAYETARDLAMGDTDLPEQTFPLNCPYDLTEIVGDRFYPGESSELLND